MLDPSQQPLLASLRHFKFYGHALHGAEPVPLVTAKHARMQGEGSLSGNYHVNKSTRNHLRSVYTVTETPFMT